MEYYLLEFKSKYIFYEEIERQKDHTMVNQNLDLKEYVRNSTLFSARMIWEIRSRMLDVAGNYPGHSKYKASSWLCQACNIEVKEDQDHLTECVEEVVEFFNSVMEKRKLNERQGRRCTAAQPGGYSI